MIYGLMACTKNFVLFARKVGKKSPSSSTSMSVTNSKLNAFLGLEDNRETELVQQNQI